MFSFQIILSLRTFQLLNINIYSTIVVSVVVYC
jgi:hypothetical protein